ncbi:MAG TPA: alpha-N-arabinofuranosidase [Intrasporangium sp.]|uniref:arabinosylfuranosidase ArfA n=1 Tax=Intrasporangium sp. TaxID=1925024 RepID=UPI002D791ED0|nr:alpha-N-arabinofuranosidase [Intrasporangium sp.]HET7397089.1 alpha-N-arabinofuranosidase [Intrasporangium sp.]
MPSTRIVLDPAFTVGQLDRRVFGSFVEHMGRCVYTGIYEPEHPSADEHGFRGDVARLTREGGVTLVRYPGGNFVSGYRWEDGVGPVEERPARVDLAWRSVESNEVGLNEFVGWARRTGVEPMLAVNLGTRGVQEACDLLEYANYPGGTAWSDLRASHGHPKPHGIRLWCLGNEMDGPWQTGHKTAQEYGRLALETAKAMRQVDPDIELVACGSSNSAMPTFGYWEATVLEHCYDAVDYISLHAYYEERDGDLASFLASSVDMDHFIRSVIATADHIGATRRSRKKINLSFDEWNVWYQQDFAGHTNLDVERTPRLIEDTFSVADAVAVGGFLNTLIRHADRVKIACQAQLANVIGLIRSEPAGPAWRQTIYHPFAQTARLARGTVLQAQTRGATHETAVHGVVDSVDATATWDEPSGQLAVFLVNRNPTEAVDVTVELRGFAEASLQECLRLADDDPRAVNTIDEPDRVGVHVDSGAHVQDGCVSLRLPPVSWTALDIRTTQP